MIIKPKVRGNGGKLAAYLLADKKNDRAELLEMRGFYVPTLKGALQMEEEIATTATHCENPFYHVSFRAAPGEQLTPEQWRQCADKLEQALGLEGHSRALVMHTHKGEQHLHAVWSRIDEQTMTAARLYRDWPRCQQVARELEQEFALRQVRDRAPERERTPPTFKEEQQERRTGKRLDQAHAAIRAAWEHSDDGRSLAAALEERGFVLAKGDRRDYVAVDERGGVHSIGKRATGASAAEVRARLADLDRDAMPTVEQARERQRERGGDNERNEERKQERKFELEHAAPAPEKARPEAAPPDRAAERFIDASLDAVEGFLDFFVGPTPKPARTAKKTERAATRPNDGVIDASLNAVEGLIDFFVGPPPPTKARHEPEPPRAEPAPERAPPPQPERQAESGIDWDRYLNDPDYRQQRFAADAERQKQQKEQEQERKTEAGRTRQRER